MEILGRNIPTLQNAISSGLESVTAGITEGTRTSGVSALGIAQESFSFTDSAISGSANLPAVADAGEYPAPVTYFRNFSGDVATAFPLKDFSKTMESPQFRADQSLTDFVSQYYMSAGSLDGPLSDANYVIKEPRKFPELFSDVPHIGSDSDRSVRDRTYSKQMEEYIAEKNQQMIDKMSEMEQKQRGSLDSAVGNSVAQKAADPFDPTMTLDEARNHTSVYGTAASGSASGASSRSIIVVGGKTSDTYFGTLDDSARLLQQNPTVETAQLYQDQVGAVQTMVSTVDQTIQMQKNLMSGLLIGGLRV